MVIQDPQAVAIAYAEIVGMTNALNGYLVVYSDATKSTLLAKGLFVNGRLTVGERLYTKKRWFAPSTIQWQCGQFNDADELVKGEIYADSTKMRFVSSGDYSNGQLINGEMIMPSGRCFIGVFDEAGCLVNGSVYTDHTKTKFLMKGEYGNNMLLNGEYADPKTGNYYVGEFGYDKIIRGKIYADATKTHLLRDVH